MKKDSTGHDFAVQKGAGNRLVPSKRSMRLALIAAAGLSLATLLPHDPHAQQRFKEPTVTVTGVNATGNVVSITADGALSHAQTWQDSEGFHVMLVNGQSGLGGSARGVKVRRVSNTLELVVPVRAGANVTVQPRGNRLDLVVSGGAGALSVENFPVEQPRAARSPGQGQAAAPEQSAVRERMQASRPEMNRRNPAESAPAELAQNAPPPAAAQPQRPTPPQATAPAPVETAGASAPPPVAPPEQASNQPVEAQPASMTVEEGGGLGLLSLVTSLPSLLVLLGVALAGAVVILVRRRRAGGFEDDSESDTNAAASRERAAEKPATPFEHSKGDRRKASIAVPFERRTSGRGAEDEATRRARELAGEGGAQPDRASESKTQPAAPAMVFGAYRIEQEVDGLVSGGPHSTEILSSRASDDRRAVETSLLKALRAPETDEDGRRRARTALEDYGFVARSCAALLLGGETFERVSAARTLGDMKSAQALPFLTEALYDPDPVVRTECVQSLGALGLPSAIGALLDVARRHQDLPASVLGPALTACSVESLQMSWDVPPSFGALTDAPAATQPGDDVRMIAPAVESYEELPESAADESLSAALARLESTDPEKRAVAAQQLAQFQVRRAVSALAASARNDSESAVRSAAVNSLGLINHESVFAHVITALADEAREVRAAAARALSRLSFDRADAYVRLVETADARTLRDVARACVKAGLAAQAVSRLTSADRRQAYEAFSLLTLCVNGGEAQPVVEAVETHPNIDTRLHCIQLLGDSRSPEVCDQLMRLAGNGGVPERVRRSILETVERAPSPQLVEAG